jgi:chemotaxis protein CheX
MFGLAQSVKTAVQAAPKPAAPTARQTAISAVKQELENAIRQATAPEKTADQILIGSCNPVLEAAAREIFEVMLGLPLGRVTADPPVVADVTVMVGFSGQRRGVFGLHCQANTACRLATLLLGAETDEFDERVLDAVGEIANMVAGNFKSKVPALGENCLLSVPTVISGADYHLHASPGGEHLEMSLSCEGSPLWLTLDLRK